MIYTFYLALMRIASKSALEKAVKGLSTGLIE